MYLVVNINYYGSGRGACVIGVPYPLDINGGKIYEGKHPPQVRSRQDPLRVRQHRRDQLDQEGALGRHLLELSPLLHRRAEVHGHRRQDRKIQ